MQERDRTHGAGGGDEDLTRILLMMMMDMKILMARMMWTIDYEVCASGTGRYVEDCNSEGDDDHYDDGNGDGDDIYIMMKCLSVCLSRKMSTSSFESPVTSCNHP